MRFILDQRSQPLLDSVQLLFNFGKVTLRTETADVYRYTAYGFSRMITIRKYFESYPLLTKKVVSFNKWCAIHDMILSQKHLTQEGLDKLQALRKEINLNNSMTNKTGAAK